MINIIVGENSTGKTRVLKEMYEAEVNPSIFSLDESERYESILLDTAEVRNVTTALGLTQLKYDTRQIRYAYCSYPQTNALVVNTAFLGIINLLCKDVKVIYLDEPETLLTEIDCIRLKCALTILEKDVWMTTHSRSLMWDDFQYYSIGDNSLKKVTWEEAYELTV